MTLPSRFATSQARDIGMVEWDAASFFEGEAEKPARGLKNGGDHIVQLEIRHQLCAVDAKLGAAALFGVMMPVPRG